MQRPLFLDMDPGVDDALAIAVLASDPSLAITGASAVHGNVNARAAARNLAALLRMAGRPEVPVRIGAQKPLVQDPSYAPHIHGEDGVGGESPKLAEAPEPDVGGVSLLLAESHAYAGTLEIVATGPLTTLALALIEDPTLPGRIRHVHVMGGAFWGPGNITPLAEANVYHDPEAAHLVFGAGWPLTVSGLDVTTQVLWEEAGIARLESYGDRAPFLSLLGRMSRFYAQAYAPRLGRVACPLHDPLTALLVTRPDLIQSVETPVLVECGGSYSRGRTLVGPYGELDGRTRPEVRVARTVDARGALSAFEDAVHTLMR